MVIADNGLAHLFDSISLYLNQKKIDSTRNLGITSTMIGFGLLTQYDESSSSGFVDPHDLFAGNNEDFVISYPLKYLLGFANTYRLPIVASDLTLELVRSRTTDKVFFIRNKAKPDDRPAQGVDPRPDPTREGLTFEVTGVSWYIPRIFLNETHKLTLLKRINTDSPIVLPFRTFSHFDLKIPQNQRKLSWNIASLPAVDTPRWALVALQTSSENSNSSKFNVCNLTTMQMFVNNQAFPPHRFQTIWGDRAYLEYYTAFKHFRSEYYESGYDSIAPHLSFGEWVNSPVYVIAIANDQGEVADRGSSNLTLEIEASENFANNTTIHVVLIQDRIVEYKPISKVVYAQ